MTRDELVQVAIVALADANPKMYVDTLYTNSDIREGAMDEAVGIVVDAVLAKLGAVAVIPRHADGRPVHVTQTSVDIHDVSYTETTFYEE